MPRLPVAAATRAATRFPAALTIALVAAVTLSRSVEFGRWVPAFAAAFAGALALRLAVEARPSVPAAARHLLPWLPAGLAALPLWPGMTMTIAATLLAAAAGLAIFATPMVLPAARRAAIAPACVRGAMWAVGPAVFSALVAALGLTALVFGIDALFGAGLGRHVNRPIWSVAFTLGQAWVALALIPELDGEPAEIIPRWLDLLLDWLLVPLTLAYGALLDLYCLMVLMTWHLPKGVIANMVIAFAAMGGAVWAATNGGPGRSRQARWLRRAFLPGLAAPAAAMALAAWMRVGEYGLTVSRIALLTAALAIAALVALQLIRRRVPDPSLAALVVAAALAAISFGPWGAAALSIRDQSARLREVLERTGRLQDGHLHPEAPAVSDADARKVTAALMYLLQNDAEPALAGWLPLPPPGKDGNRFTRSGEILAALNVPRAQANWRNDSFSWYAAESEPIAVDGYDLLVIARVNAGRVESRAVNGRMLALTLGGDGRRVELRTGERLLAAFDLSPATADPPPGKQPLVLVGQDAEGKPVRLDVVSVNGTKDARGRHVTGANIRLLLKR